MKSFCVLGDIAEVDFVRGNPWGHRQRQLWSLGLEEMVGRSELNKRSFQRKIVFKIIVDPF